MKPGSDLPNSADRTWACRKKGAKELGTSGDSTRGIGSLIGYLPAPWGTERVRTAWGHIALQGFPSEVGRVI